MSKKEVENPYKISFCKRYGEVKHNGKAVKYGYYIERNRIVYYATYFSDVRGDIAVAPITKTTIPSRLIKKINDFLNG